MNPESHERARKLLHAARVEGISADSRAWLEAHLASCKDCSAESNALAAAIDSLRALSVGAPADLVRRTSIAVRQGAALRQADRERRILLAIAVALSGAWTIAATFLTWTFFAWLGQAFHVHDMVLRVGFLMWWFVPAAVLSAIAAWRHVTAHEAVSNLPAEMDWRTL
jgi:hypothetical protein